MDKRTIAYFVLVSLLISGVSLFAWTGVKGQPKSLLNRLSQKGTRPQDVPTKMEDLFSEEKAMIKRRYLFLF